MPCAGSSTCPASRRSAPTCSKRWKPRWNCWTRRADTDEALYFHRVALFHEDLRCEQLVTLAQTLGLPLKLALPVGIQGRDPVLVPAGRWLLGSRPGGFAFDVEREAHEIEVPEFEIDAQPVNWAQFVEFVDDGGYDRPEFWQPAGREWLEHEAGQEGRRGPRYVEQIGAASGAVLQTHFGQAARMASNQSVMHVSWWEADAWARWAGRRLPTEVEWEMAAHAASRRGFRWGDVREWTASTLRPWPGYSAGRLDPPHRPRSAAMVRAGPGAARRLVRRALAHEASEVPRLRAAGTRRRVRRLSHLQQLRIHSPRRMNPWLGQCEGARRSRTPSQGRPVCTLFRPVCAAARSANPPAF